MNIYIQNNKTGEIYSKGDSSFNKELDIFYKPDYVEEVAISFALCTRILKSGKYIKKRFVESYYDSLYLATILKPNLTKDSPFADNIYIINSLDNTFTLSKDVIKFSETKTKRFKADNLKIESILIKEDLEKMIENISSHTTLKSGDFVCVEIFDLGNINNRYEFSLQDEQGETIFESSILIC